MLSHTSLEPCLADRKASCGTDCRPDVLNAASVFRPAETTELSGTTEVAINSGSTRSYVLRLSVPSLHASSVLAFQRPSLLQVSFL